MRRMHNTQTQRLTVHALVLFMLLLFAPRARTEPVSEPDPVCTLCLDGVNSTLSTKQLLIDTFIVGLQALNCKHVGELAPQAPDCAAFQQTAGHYCGCPVTEETMTGSSPHVCRLCGDGQLLPDAFRDVVSHEYMFMRCGYIEYSTSMMLSAVEGGLSLSKDLRVVEDFRDCEDVRKRYGLACCYDVPGYVERLAKSNHTEPLAEEDTSRELSLTWMQIVGIGCVAFVVGSITACAVYYKKFKSFFVSSPPPTGKYEVVEREEVELT